jgi:ketosteroid isomerase-like protein
MQRILWLAVALLVLAVCRPPAETELSDADVAAIRATMDEYIRAVLAADSEAWGKTLASDVVYMPPNQPPIVGRTGAVAFLEAFPKVNRLETTQVNVAGRLDLAYAQGKFSFSATLPDGSAIDDGGSFLQIHRRQADQTWLISHLIWNSDAPPAPVPEPAPAPPQ